MNIIQNQNLDLSNINKEEQKPSKLILLPIFTIIFAIVAIVIYWTFFDNARIDESSVWEQVLGNDDTNSLGQVEIKDPFEGWETLYFNKLSIRYPPEFTVQERSKIMLACQNGFEITELISATPERMTIQLCHYTNAKGLSLVNFALSTNTWLSGDEWEETRLSLVKSWNTANVSREFESFVFEGKLIQSEPLSRIVFIKDRSQNDVHVIILKADPDSIKSVFTQDQSDLFMKILTSIKDKNNRVVNN